MLWAPPTDTRTPIPLAAVPEASEVVLLTRPSALASSPAGERFLDALQRLLAGTGSDVAPNAEAELHAIGLASGESYGQVAVETLVDPPADRDGPLLSRAAEDLLATSSRAAHVSLLVNLPWIAGEGGGLFKNVWAPLGETLRREVDSEWRAALLSAELVDHQTLYWELRLVGGRGVPETRRARTLGKLGAAWAEELSTLARSRAFSPYAQQLIDRLPAMVAAARRRTRVGADDGQTIANGYLPAAALHNVALATEVLVAELGGMPPTTVAATPTGSRTLAERLATPVTIRFQRESLEAAVAIIGEAVGAPIAINGRDLQLQGITRNQMVGLDVSDTPAGDAVVSLLRQANPNTEATGPADDRQQLVYVIDAATDEVVITTRAAAVGRGEPLPDAFQP